jgi:hypothetical protein
MQPVEVAYKITMNTFLLLLTAHLLGDFVFQTNWMVREKSRVGVLLLHIGIVVLLCFLLLGSAHWPILLIILLSHLGLDYLKIAMKKGGARAFISDQAGHLLVVSGLAIGFPQAEAGGWWPRLLNGEMLGWFHVVLCFVSGVILIAPAGGIMIGKLTEPIRKELETEEGVVDGLRNGGRYIGWLERLLAMLLFLINQPSGIGFLIAAKSILRFGEIKESKHRKMAEYIIIGTFLSFGWALVVSVPLKAGIDHWNPIRKPEPKAIRVIVEDQGGVYDGAPGSKPVGDDGSPPDASGPGRDNRDDRGNDAENAPPFPHSIEVSPVFGRGRQHVLAVEQGGGVEVVEVVFGGVDEFSGDGC